MIRAEHLRKVYGGRAVIEDLSVEIKTGEKCALIAPSGCGKTTLLRLLAGIEKPDGGRVERDGEVSFVFQEPRLFPQFTVLKNVAAVCAGKDAKERAAQALEKVGLGGETGKYPAELSGGMAQRAVLARALAAERETVFMDEPFKQLDAESKEALYTLVEREMRGKTLLLVTHDEAEARRLCGRILWFTEGMKLAERQG